MAKTKKTESAGKPAVKKIVKKSARSTKSAGAKPGSAQSPPINTSFAAEAAARMVTAKASTHPASPPAGESSAFKQLKQTLAKPGAKSVDNFLNSTAAPKTQKSFLPFGGGKQVGRNQTFGADVNRTGVPRRTGG